MQPALKIGDITISRTADLNAIHRGDIITFRDAAVPDAPVTHRVLTVNPAKHGLQVVTKGDANNAWETWELHENERVQLVIAHIPIVGRVLTDTPLRWILAAVLVVGALLLAFAAVRRARREQVERAARAHRRAPGLGWLTTGWITFLAVILMGTGATYGAWTAVNSNPTNTFTTQSTFSSTTTYNTCGSGVQGTLTVGAGFTSAAVTVNGGQGGIGSNASTQPGGGRGAGTQMKVTFTVQTNEQLSIYVGCAGNDASSPPTAGGSSNGYATGGAGVNGNTLCCLTGGGGGGGGSASAISCTATCVNAGLLVVAGGGGGGGGAGNAVSGGGAGGSGASATTSTQNSGTEYNGNNGSAGGAGGTAGAGGSGASTPPGNGANGVGSPYNYDGGGGGGGGGFKGGSGGQSPQSFNTDAGAGGGGAGSSWYLTAGTTFNSKSTNAAAGSVTIVLS